MKMLKYLYYYFLVILGCTVFNLSFCKGIRKYSREDLIKLREEVRQMFEHAYSSYLTYAYPYDELRPLSCDGIDTWGSYSLTLIDALDTLAVMGNYTEFQRVVDIVSSKANFDANINVSVFETNIRIVGGLLSAHLLSQRAGVKVEPGWPCNGPLLRLAEDVAKRLIAAFDTPTGMPYGTVNLRNGVPVGETSITCTAGVGTFIVEFGALSRLTGDPVYEEVALNALHALYHHRSSIGLFGNHIDVTTGRWTAQDSGIGAGVDSYFEYLVKGAILLQLPELMAMFNDGRVGIDKYLKRNDWYLWVSMQKGQVTLPVFQSLEAYWPGVLSLVGDVNAGMKSMHNYHQVWKQYGFTPEFYNIPQGQAGVNRESYPLRPELVESAMYLYRATGDPFLLDIGVDILRSIQHSAHTPCGYATIKDTRDHGKENRMESFFLAETTKYLYLLFDPDNFIHNKGQHGTIHTLPSGRECVLDAGGYVFNTEAHPLDPGALHCCSDNAEERDFFWKKNNAGAKGEKLHAHILKEENRVDETTNKDAIHIMMDQVDSSIPNLPSAFSDVDTEEYHNEKTVKSFEDNSPIDVVHFPSATDDEDITVESLEIEEQNLGLENQLKQENMSNNLDDLSEEMKLNIISYCFNSTERLMKIKNSLSVKMLGEKHLKNKEVPTVTKSSLLIREHEIISLLTQCFNMIEMIEAITTNFNTFSEKQEKLSQVIELILNFSKKFNQLIELYTQIFHREDEPVEESDRKESKNLFKRTGSTNWKDVISYQVDDSERVTPVTRLDSRPLFTDPADAKISDVDGVKVPEFVSRYLISAGSGGPEFDPQQLLERIRTGPGYYKNISWSNKYDLLSCRPQPFLTRITLSGEFYNSD